MPENEHNHDTHGYHTEGSVVVFEKPKNREEIARNTREREQQKFARDQVKTNGKVAKFTGYLVVATFLAGGISTWQARIAQTAANAARSAAQTARDTLIVSERPWIAVDSVSPAKPLEFARGNADTNFAIRIRNIGKSVAQDITIHARLFPDTRGNPILDVPKEQSTLCDNPKSAFDGFYLFPDQSRDWGVGTNTPEALLEAQSVTYPQNRSRHFVTLYLVGCVDYKLSFDARQHQTRFAYSTTNLAGLPVSFPVKLEQMIGMYQFEIGKSVPVEKIRIILWFKGNYAY